MRLQGGSYIPGFSGQAFGAGLQRDVRATRQDQARKGRALEKYMNKRGTMGKWGGKLLSGAVGVGLGAMGMGPLGMMIGKAAGAGLGNLIGGSEFLGGEGPSMQPGVGTGLRGSGYERLGEARGGIDESIRGQAAGAGAAEIVSGLQGMADKRLGEQLKSGFGKWQAGRTGQSGFEGTGLGNVLGLDAAGEASKLTPAMKLMEDPASMTGYSGFGNLGGGLNIDTSGMNLVPGQYASGISPDMAGMMPSYVSDIASDVAIPDDASWNFLTNPDPIGPLAASGQFYGGQEGGYLPQYQMGGALGRSFGLSKPSLETGSRFSDAGKWISEYDPRQTKDWMSDVDRAGTKKFMDLLGSGAEATTNVKAEDELARMKFLEAAQGRAGERVQEAGQDLLGEVGGIKDILSSREKFKEGQKFFRQQDPANEPYGEQMEPMMNPFTGEPLGELTAEDVPFRALSDLRQRKSKNPWDDVTFPEGLYQDEAEPESKSWMQRLLGRQMGGMMPGGVSNPLPYNLGGSVAQQPMAYQLGGLLKYRRSPFG